MLKQLSFNKHGLLPKGEYELTFNELRKSILVNNPTVSNWDANWRDFLVNQAEVLVNELWEVGITEIFLDGSFVEAKPHPNDIDGYFICDLAEFASGQLERRLNKLNKHKIWTWDVNSRRSYSGFVKKQLPMWHRYRVEL